MRIPWKALASAIRSVKAPAYFSPEEVAASRLGEGLPRGFLLGTATAAHQIEGGNDNDWTAWEPGSFPDGQPHVKHRDVSGAACDSWNRFETDLELMKQLGANAYRFSVEWSRLEPAPGVFREDVADRYLGWARRLRESGIEPMVTLHHFTLPRWVADAGGWENEATLDHFEAFAGRMAKRLGPAVDLWCTVNEPNVLATLAFLKGTWPPNKVSQKVSAEVFARLIEAHARAARQIKANDTVDADGDGQAARVGVAHHVRIFQPTRTLLDRVAATFTEDFFNGTLLEAVRTGRVRIWLPGVVSIDRPVADLKGSFDYLGINYYSRDHIQADLKDPSLSRQYVPEDRPKNDLGWEIYPEGLYHLLKRYAGLKLPIYITENGIADASGEVRPGFLRAHLHALQRAVQEGVDVRGYFHWSLMDNFEWAEGYEPRFGLFRVDFQSPEKTRTPTPAVRVFQEAARNLGLKPAG